MKPPSTIVKCGFGIALAFAFGTSCQSRKEPVAWESERECIELSQKLKLCEYKLGLIKTDEVSDFGHFEALVAESADRIRVLRKDLSALRAEVESMELRNDEFCRNAVENQRANALARKFDSLSVKDGRSFFKVSIAGVSDGGVSIRHEHGTARLRYAELTDEQRQLFGLEEDSALAAEEQERQELLAYEQEFEVEMDKVREIEERAVASASARQAEESRISRSLLAAASASRDSRPLAQPATPVGSGSTYRRWYGYRSYQPTYRYVYYYPTGRNAYCPARTYRSVGDNRVVRTPKKPSIKP
jgi:hypothetical protein